MKLWLDDARPMPDGYDLHVKVAADAIALLESGTITCISLDHDLGPLENGTGYDVACFIEYAAFIGSLAPLEIIIHSANPVGRARMEQAIKKAREYWLIKSKT